MRRLLLALALTLATAAGAAANPDGIAVIVGNRTYVDRVPEVAYAHRDAEAMRRFVVDVLGYREGNVFVALDAGLGRMTALFGSAADHRGELFYAVRPDEADVVMFYSGHGMPGPAGADGSRQGFLLPADASARAPAATGYPLDLLLANLEKLPARSVTVLLDACFSGRSDAGMLVQGVSPFGVEAVAPPKRPAMTVLSAATGAQYAVWDREAGHGLFTEYLLRGLYGAADDARYGTPDGRVTAAELEAYLAREMSYRARRDHRTEQTAQASGDRARVLASWTGRPPSRPVLPPVAPAPVAAVAPPPAPVPSPAAMEAGLGLDLPARREVQSWLTALGFDPGGVDGVFGAGTRRAIGAWQGSLPQPSTGFLGPSQYALLGERGRAAVAAGRPAPARAPAVAAVPPSVVSSPLHPAAPVAGARFRDCPSCPEMVWLPPGVFTMGSPPSDEDRDDDEGPQRRVRIDYPLAVGVHEVTRREFGRFVSSTGRSMEGACRVWKDGKYEERSGRNWRSPGYTQGDDHPVVCVNWDDAQAYVRWLGRETGKGYRLLSESEWEYAARGGTTTSRWWGTTAAAACRSANVPDEALAEAHELKQVTDNIFLCRDGHVYTAPVRSFGANPFGLHDVLGNVWEWVGDCWNESYAGAPSDGRPWKSGECSRRVVRGGSWSDVPWSVRAAFRGWLDSGDRDDDLGFRVARTD